MLAAGVQLTGSRVGLLAAGGTYWQQGWLTGSKSDLPAAGVTYQQHGWLTGSWGSLRQIQGALHAAGAWLTDNSMGVSLAAAAADFVGIMTRE